MALNIEGQTEQTLYPENTRGRSLPLTRETLISFVEGMLGAPQIQLEVSSQSYTSALDITLGIFNTSYPRVDHGIINPVNPAIKEYNLRELGKPFGRGISDVSLTEQSQFFSPVGGVFSLGIPKPSGT